VLDRPEFSRTGKYGAFIGRVVFYGSPISSSRADKIYVAVGKLGPDPICTGSQDIARAYGKSLATGKNPNDNIEFVHTNYANPVKVHSFEMGYHQPFDNEMRAR